MLDLNHPELLAFLRDFAQLEPGVLVTGISRIDLVFFLFLVDVTTLGLSPLLRSSGCSDLALLLLDHNVPGSLPSLHSFAHLGLATLALEVTHLGLALPLRQLA